MRDNCLQLWASDSLPVNSISGLLRVLCFNFWQVRSLLAPIPSPYSCSPSFWPAGINDQPWASGQPPTRSTVLCPGHLRAGPCPSAQETPKPSWFRSSSTNNPGNPLQGSPRTRVDFTPEADSWLPEALCCSVPLCQPLERAQHWPVLGAQGATGHLKEEGQTRQWGMQDPGRQHAVEPAHLVLPLLPAGVLITWWAQDPEWPEPRGAVSARLVPPQLTCGDRKHTVQHYPSSSSVTDFLWWGFDLQQQIFCRKSQNCCAESVSVSNQLTGHFVIPRTIACQAPLSLEFSRQEYWKG